MHRLTPWRSSMRIPLEVTVTKSYRSITNPALALRIQHRVSSQQQFSHSSRNFVVQIGSVDHLALLETNEVQGRNRDKNDFEKLFTSVLKGTMVSGCFVSLSRLNPRWTIHLQHKNERGKIRNRCKRWATARKFMKDLSRLCPGSHWIPGSGLQTDF